jgi:hypothetical protein|tara:strand:- start:270 stop:800 length:531 start_codon:yes stop_codon:yes gene_type:complete
MALKGDRHEFETTTDFFLNEVAERGGIVTLSTAGSGAALDQSAALVTYAAAESGLIPVGLLLNDMVNNDQTRTHINFHKNEMQKGGKVTLLKKGWVVTNFIDPGVTIVGGDRAFVGPSGYISNSNNNSGATATSLNRKNRGGGMIVGQFDSLKDEDGYAKVSINLPQGDANYYPNR